MWIVWLEKKILKTLGIILSIIIILITALHVYVVNNAESLIEEIVFSESKGKLKAKVKNIKFNYFSKKIELEDVAFFSNDSLDLKTSYFFQVDKIKIRVKALIPIFSRRELRIDSLALDAPKIEVTRLKPILDTSRSEISIPHEMGRIYNSIMDALRYLEVKRFQFDEGEFKLINKIIPDQRPLVITGMHFHIEDFKVDSSSSADDFPESNKLVFWTKNQDITFPDGNHRLAFSRFRIKIKKRLIEIDSCTMIGRREGPNPSGYSVFVDTLKLTNVDFESLYERDLIKADSVYCLNPNLQLNLELKDREAGAKRKIPNLDTIINQLTGDLQLKYVGVKNASLNIVTTRNDKTTSFTSEQNNFEMTGLNIDHSLAEPVSLEGFDMAIRNYENFVKDSSYFLRFDSIRLRESRILLSNFSINTEPYKDKRNIQVQQFVLSGLSWADLLFDRKLVARSAILIRPVIDYTQPLKERNKHRGPLANSLAGLNDYMSLDKIQVENGKIKIKTQSKVELILEDANLVVNSENVSDSISIEEVKSSVEILNFRKGIMRTKNLLVNMDNASFDGATRKFEFQKVSVYDHHQTFNVNAKNVTLDSLIFNDSTNTVSGKGIKWRTAMVEINMLGEEKKTGKEQLLLTFKDIQGSNTQLYLNNSKNSLSVFLNELAASSVVKNDNTKIGGLKLDGKSLYWFDQHTSITASQFNIADNAVSSLNAFQFRQTKDSNSVDIQAPSVVFNPDVQSMINGRPDIKNLRLTSPVISIVNVTKRDSNEKRSLPTISIDQLELTNPVFSIQNNSSKEFQKAYWDGKDNTIFLKDFTTDKLTNELKISSLKTKVSSFNFTNIDNKTTSSRDGALNVTLSDLSVKPGKKLEWSVKVNEIEAKNFTADSLGKKPANILVDGVLKNFVFGSSISGDLKAIIEKNPSLNISNVSGHIIDEKKSVRWYNFSYDKPNQTASLDSFSYLPALTRDEFIKASPWQTDYMTVNTGRVTISKFNIDQYLEDSVFRAGNVAIDQPYFTSYRDKRPPFRSGIIKPLAAKLVQQIPFKVSVDTILIADGNAIYTELNDKTNEAGEVKITRINGDIFPIKNVDIKNTDSLRIRLNFYLLDSGWVRLRTRESYMDSLSGFLITLRMKPHSMLYLNKILAPLASIKLQSGYLDTLTMRAVGREHLSLGEMRMNYHDLKIQFLKDGKEEKKRFLQSLITFIANSFVIKNENKKRVGIVYFPRLRDRSFINYYIKIAMSGVASSVGAKKNKRLLRRYEKQLKTRQLPPMDFD
jgi:hypothetical protein